MPISLGRRFVVRTDHFTLKFLLDQRLSTMPQHQWISKLFDFDFTMEYRPGRLNMVADALSCYDFNAVATDAGAHAISRPSFRFIDDIRAATSTADDSCRLLQQLQDGELGEPWRLAEGLLLHGSHIYVLAHDDLRH